jgi:hypothetical protein
MASEQPKLVHKLGNLWHVKSKPKPQIKQPIDARNPEDSTSTTSSAHSQSLLPADHLVVPLNEKNVARFADSLWKSERDIELLKLDISSLHSTTASKGLDRVLRFVNSSTSLREVDVIGSGTRSCLGLVAKRFLQAMALNQGIQRVTLQNLHLDGGILLGLISRPLKHLGLINCSIPESVQEAVSVAIGTNEYIRNLTLLRLEESLLVSILRQIKLRPPGSLKVLDVSFGSLLTAEAIGDVVRVTQPMHLILRDSALLHLETMVREWTRVTSLRRLDVIGCDLDAIAASVLRAYLRTPIIQLQQLCLSDMELDEGNLEEILGGVRQCASLKRLKLHLVHLQTGDVIALKDLIRNNKYLTNIDLDRSILSSLEHVGALERMGSKRRGKMSVGRAITCI